ncbi:hypothetical protein X943_001713 [Babesia divergens]|uniref:Checkpoint protein n=1 Tax=Babesia divergens TaxID=32595 RepID=A0AAD9GHV2_BABDI|nr:hypothetical protein X943_001713 [Babesia divergens]
MKFRGEFIIENLHHFVGCLLSLNKLAVEDAESMNSVIRITDKKVSVVTKTTLSSEAILEIYTVGHEKSQKAKNVQEELFHSPYTLEAKEDGAIALNVSVNSLYETLSAAVTSEHAVLKLKRDNDGETSLSVTFPDPEYPSISIVLDISISPLEEYDNKRSLIPEIPPCHCNVGLTKFQSIICFLESAARIGNDFVEFEIVRMRPYIFKTQQEGEGDAEKITKEQQLTRKTEGSAETKIKSGNSEETVTTKKGNSAEVKVEQKGEATEYTDNVHADNECMHHSILLKLRSPGVLADMETIYSGMQSFSSHINAKPDLNIPEYPKTLLRTDVVYTICRNAADSIIYNKHEALLVIAIPDDYLKTDWTYFIFSVVALDSCQMVFMIQNESPDAE